MVRTKADAGSTKVSAAKAPRKVGSGGGSSATATYGIGSSSKDRYSGGNSYNPQPIPNWQKGISAFFKLKGDEDKDNNPAEEDVPLTNGCSSIKSEASQSTSESKTSESLSTEDVPSCSFENNGIISDNE